MSSANLNALAVPETLRWLPQPWGLTSRSRRRQQLQQTGHTLESLQTALEALERCLAGLADLQHRPKAVPESLLSAWGLLKESLADRMPTVEQLQQDEFRRLVASPEQPNPSVEAVDAVLVEWLQGVVSSMIQLNLNWLKQGKHALVETGRTERLLKIAADWAERVPPDVAGALLGAATVVAGKQAIPLLQHIEASPAAHPDVRASARSYRDAITG
jgi:hypothetical protein